MLAAYIGLLVSVTQVVSKTATRGGNDGEGRLCSGGISDRRARQLVAIRQNMKQSKAHAAFAHTRTKNMRALFNKRVVVAT